MRKPWNLNRALVTKEPLVNVSHPGAGTGTLKPVTSLLPFWLYSLKRWSIHKNQIMPWPNWYKSVPPLKPAIGMQSITINFGEGKM